MGDLACVCINGARLAANGAGTSRRGVGSEHLGQVWLLIVGRRRTSGLAAHCPACALGGDHVGESSDELQPAGELLLATGAVVDRAEDGIG